MVPPITASLSFATSSGAQTGDLYGGDLILGGSGGASKSALPPWLIVVGAVLAAFAILAWMLKK